MPTARYWRLAQCESYYLTGLELSEVALYSAGTRIDGSAILSCPTPLSSGTLENLRDSSFASTVRWGETYPLPPGFALVWDFGSDVSVDEVGVAGPSQSTFLHKFSLQHSSDGIVWSGNPFIRTKFIGSDTFFNYVPFSTESDPYFEYVSLLLHMDGANGSTVFTDSSPRPKPINVFGSPAPALSSLKSKFGGTSLLVNATASAIHAGIEADSSSDFDFGTGDFTVEWWQYWVSRSTPPYQAAFQRGYNAAGSITLVTGNADGKYALVLNTTQVLKESTAAALNTWTHFALVRSGKNFTLWRDGNFSASGRSALSVGIAKKFAIGCYASDSENIGQVFNGYIDDLRITKGVARYTENFAPPTVPFPNSASGVIADLTPLRQRLPSDAVSISEYPVSPTTSVISTGEAPHLDVQDGGSGRIVGTVKEKATPSNTPLRRKVWLLNYNDGRIVRETWSDELTGDYEFTNIDMNRTYTVVSLDHTGQYRAAIADNLSPEKM